MNIQWQGEENLTQGSKFPSVQNGGGARGKQTVAQKLSV
jgi:hypothetical protein